MHRFPWRIIALILFSLGLACFVEHQAFFSPVALNDDVRNQVYWMARITDPGLFPNDYIAAYFTQPSLISPVVWGIYWLAGHWMDSVQFTRFLPLILIVFTTFFIYQFAKSYAGKRYATWAVFLFNILIWTEKNFAGGLPRAFFYPLLFSFLWFLQKRRCKSLIVALWLCSLIYPPAFFIAFGLLLTETWHERKNAKDMPVLRKALWIGALGGMLILAGRYLSHPQTALFGPISNAANVEKTPEFYLGGRVLLFEFSHQPVTLPYPLGFAEDILERIPHLPYTITLIVVGGALLLYRRYGQPRFGPLQVPGSVWRLLGVSCFLYIVAWLVIFYLYVPERYLLSLPIVYVFLILAVIQVLEKNIFALVPSARKQQLITTGAVMLSLLIAMPNWRSDLISPHQEHVLTKLSSFFAAQPKNIMIAAKPNLASNFPLFSRRSVLVSDEAYIPFHQVYFRQMKQRLKDWMMAYYSTDSSTILAFLKKYHIDYMVINRQDFLPYWLNALPKRTFHTFSPTFYQDILTAGQIKPYALSKIPTRCAVLTVDSYMIVPASAFIRKECAL